MNNIKLNGLSWTNEATEVKTLELKANLLDIKLSRLIFDSCLEQCNESLCDYTLSEVKEKLEAIRENMYNSNGFTLDLNSTEAFIIDIDTATQELKERHESDLYILGCFNDWFISECTDIDIDVINTLQKSEGFEALGKLIVKSGCLQDMMESYISADGAGHAFGSYDGNNDEVTFIKGDNTYSFYTMRSN